MRAAALLLLLVPATAPAEGGLTIAGYLDVGFADAQGDGTSFLPGDTRLPADYVVDTFATAVNSRGDVASVDSRGLFVNGFLPRSAGIGGAPSFLINTVDLDLLYQVPDAPVLVFARLQALPRFTSEGDGTRFLVQQAFGRITPISSREWIVAAGKMDSVFGIEYLENEANLRTGITPSLIARYTTGQGLGVRTFTRVQLPSLWSALSLNVAATAGGPLVEALADPYALHAGAPVGSARLGYELNLPRVQVKAGGSAMYGPRNDQTDSSVRQGAVGADLRLYLYGLSLTGEIVRLVQQEGTGAGKVNGTGVHEFASGFRVSGWYATASYALDLGDGALRLLSPYVRYEERQAEFDGFPRLHLSRITAGARLDLWDSLALKAEVLLNGEVSGAPPVENDVLAASAVWTF